MIPQKLVGVLSRVTVLFPHVEELRWETQAGTYKPVAQSNQWRAIQTSVNPDPTSIKICATLTVYCYSGPQRSAPLWVWDIFQHERPGQHAVHNMSGYKRQPFCTCTTWKVQNRKIRKVRQWTWGFPELGKARLSLLERLVFFICDDISTSESHT